MTTDSCPSLPLHWLPRDLSRALWHPIHASDSDSPQSFPSMIGSYWWIIRGCRAKSLMQPDWLSGGFSWFPFHSCSYTSLAAAWLPQTIHISLGSPGKSALYAWNDLSEVHFFFPLKKVSFFKLENSCFSMLCWFLAHNLLNQPYIYIQPLPLEPSSHFLPHLTPLGYHRAPIWATCVIQQLLTSFLFYIW